MLPRSGRRALTARLRWSVAVAVEESQSSLGRPIALPEAESAVIAPGPGSPLPGGSAFGERPGYAGDPRSPADGRSGRVGPGPRS
ncbi:hypothetical protein BRC94_01970 [Halobacteriales archaeon QS_5_70_17]|nr:MAG: hypothetical protein BRC94_01970 [Halobacteriales archaeon QS_5_70_17]